MHFFNFISLLVIYIYISEPVRVIHSKKKIVLI